MQTAIEKYEALDSHALNVSALRQGRVFLIEQKSPVKHGAEILTVELLNLGYLVDSSALEGVSENDAQAILRAAREVSGAALNYRPMYPGFPRQVRGLSTLRLLVDQVTAYFVTAMNDVAGADLDPFAGVDRALEVRPGLPLVDLLVAAKPLEVCGVEELPELLVDVVQKPVAMGASAVSLVRSIVAVLATPYDGTAREDVLDEVLDIGALLPSVSNAENRSHLIRALADAGADRTKLALDGLSAAQSADQALRVILALYSDSMDENGAEEYERAWLHLSDGHARTVGMFSLPFAVRKKLMHRLADVTKDFYADELLRRRRLWRRVFRYVHPYTLRGLSDGGRRAAEIAQGHREHRTFNSSVEAALTEGDFNASLALLRQRPGLLMRKLRQLSAMKSRPKDFRELVEVVGDEGVKAQMATLISARNGLAAAMSDVRKSNTRVAGRANVLTEQKKVGTKQGQALVGALDRAMEARIRSRLTSAPESGIGVIDDEPYSTFDRDAAITDRAMERGTRFSIGADHGVLRIFVHWYNSGGRTDLDLGALFLNEKFHTVSAITWDSHSSGRGYATYSGDVQNAPLPDGGTEFIDIDMAKALAQNKGVRYVAMTVLAYTGEQIGKVRNFAGVMLRSDGDVGQLFDPRTVSTGFTMTTNSTSVVPLVADLKTGKIIWLDTDAGHSRGYDSITSSSGRTLAQVIEAELAVPRLTYGDLARRVAAAMDVPVLEKAVDRSLIERVVAL